MQPTLQVMERLRADGAVAPNSVMYNLAMGACVRGGDWEAALRLFDERCAREGRGRGKGRARVGEVSWAQKGAGAASYGPSGARVGCQK